MGRGRRWPRRPGGAALGESCGCCGTGTGHKAVSLRGREAGGKHRAGGGPGEEVIYRKL